MGQPRREPAQSLTEFALVLPALIALLFGIIEVAIMLNIYVSLTNSAREGARAGAIYQETAAITNQAGVTAMDGRRRAAITTAITETLNPMVRTNLLTTTVIYTPTTPTADSTGFINYYRAGDVMTVQLRYTHQLFWGLLGRQQIDLRATSSMDIEPGGVRRIP